MKNCLEYWKTRAKLAEAVIAENQIGAWRKWKTFISVPHLHLNVDENGMCKDCKEQLIK